MTRTKTALKLRCERDALADALSTVSRAISTRLRGNPALSCILLTTDGDELHLAATDLDMTIQTLLPIPTGTDGSALVPGRLLAEVVRSLEPGAVDIAADQDGVTVSGGRAQFHLRGMDAKDFPVLPEPEGSAVELPVADFAAALRQVVPAAAHDDTRPILTGVLLSSEDGEGLTMVATDSYRLARKMLPKLSMLGEGQSVLVPSRALSELERLAVDPDATLRVFLGSLQVSFTVDRTSLTSRLVEGEYPDYNRLIPTDPPIRLEVGRQGLVDAIKRARLMASGPDSPIRMKLAASGAELSAGDGEGGLATEQFDATYEGPDMSLGFNPKYLGEALESIGGESVVFGLTDSLKPVIIRPSAGEDLVVLVMPVRLS